MRQSRCYGKLPPGDLKLGWEMQDRTGHAVIHERPGARGGTFAGVDA